ncbi:serine--tRNA ligase [Patescibacteria group bacterium]|nr:serine--tRNA ligase [Patescibacteria group bacterium]
MLDPRFIREHIAEVKENIRRRRLTVDVDAYIASEDARLTLLKEVEALRRERNEVAQAIPKASAEERNALIEQGKQVKELIASKEALLAEHEKTSQDLALQIPNMTHPDVPEGGSDAENKEISQVGKIRPQTSPKSHTELTASLDLLDFERAAKVTGAKFYYTKRDLVILEQALILWALQELRRDGFIPIETPDLAKDEVLRGTGYQPRGDETQIYSIEGTDLSLVGTAEITVGGYHKDEILEEDQLPLKYVGLSHCFRTEAGSYGRESYGLYRVHQFSKVEMFVFCAPWQSEALHEEIRRLEERLFTKLGIPYRVLDICTADLGGPAYRKYDLDAWMWGKKEGAGDWGEVTSASNCTDFQARRLNIKMRKKDGSLEYVHTLNGTAIALSRAPIAILENYQQEDGSILVPEVLRPFCGFDVIR